MNTQHYTHEQLIKVAQFTQRDLEHINQCRRPHNRLGFGYQLACVRLFNRFPVQQPFEVLDEVLAWIRIQLQIPSELIHRYSQRQPTISNHQEKIRNYLGLRKFGEIELSQLTQFIFEEACRLEQTAALLSKTQAFLKEHKILQPYDDSLRRIIGAQREEAKQHIFKKIVQSLTPTLLETLDNLLDTKERHFSVLHELKQPPGIASPKAIVKLTQKLERIEATGVLTVDLTWLNNNFQRSLSRYVKRRAVTRLRELVPDHRYAA